MRTITCTNNDGLSMTFGDKLSPYLLESAEGLYSVNNTLNISDNSMLDGATFYGSLMQKRNIILYLRDKGNYPVNRMNLYTLFKRGTMGTLTYREDDIVREIDYYVETITSDTINPVRTTTISLMCPDPLFKDGLDTVVNMAVWQHDFTLPHEFNNEELGHYVVEKLVTIANDSIDDVPIEVSFYAGGNVTNPYLLNASKNEIIKVNISMVAGDELIVKTDVNNKNIYLNGVKVNQYLDEDTTFWNLKYSDNIIRFGADDGEDYLQVKVIYRNRYYGA